MRKKTKYLEVFNNNPDLENELQNINLSGLVESLGPDSHPSFTLENFHIYYDGILNKNIFDKIALDFYNELGCLENGMIRNNI